jgi:KaiC/GvpD/RAD55 family RecA-like ATPase
MSILTENHKPEKQHPTTRESGERSLGMAQDLARAIREGRQARMEADAYKQCFLDVLPAAARAGTGLVLPDGRPLTSRALAPLQLEFADRGRDEYVLSAPSLGVQLEFRLQSSHRRMVGELCVTSSSPAGGVVDNVLSIEELNLSSHRSRHTFARHLQSLSPQLAVPWTRVLEVLFQRVRKVSKRRRNPVLLGDLPDLPDDPCWELCGLSVPKSKAAVIFGDGGSGKSLFALRLAGQLAQAGSNVLYLDWEDDGQEHKSRLRALFGAHVPAVHYLACDEPLVQMVDDIDEAIRHLAIDYVVVDSVMAACDGPPESAEVVGRYFQAVRRLGVGSLHISHVTKAHHSDAGDQKPFGSVAWHNQFRRTWFAQRMKASSDGSSMMLKLEAPKNNSGPTGDIVVHEVLFTGSAITFQRRPASSPEPQKSSVPNRLKDCLLDGGLDRDELRAALSDVDPGTVGKALNRLVADGQVVEVDCGGRKVCRLSLPEAS